MAHDQGPSALQCEELKKKWQQELLYVEENTMDLILAGKRY